MSNKVSEDEWRCVEDAARLLAPWGVPPVAARLYGRLLLYPNSVGLDQITEDLGIGKSNERMAARLLDNSTLSRCHHAPGTERALLLQSGEA